MSEIASIAQAVRAGLVSPVEPARSALKRLGEREAGPRPLNAFLATIAPDALKLPGAGAKGVEGRLAGVPVAVKDNLATTRRGSPRRALQRCWRHTGPRTRQPPCDGSATRGRSSWARRTWMSSPWARRARTRRSGQYAIPWIRHACPVEAPVGRQQRSRRGWCRARSAPTPGGR